MCFYKFLGSLCNLKLNCVSRYTYKRYLYMYKNKKYLSSNLHFIIVQKIEHLYTKFFHSLKWWCGLVFEAPGSGSLTLLTLYWITSFCNIIVASVNLQSFPKLLSHLYWAESSKLDFGRFLKY